MKMRFLRHNSRLRRFLLVVASAALLSGCSSAAPSQERLTSVLQRHVRYLPDNHLDPLVEEMKTKEVIFLGEFHGVAALHRVEDDLVARLGATRAVVYAWEMAYSLSPFYEAASLGTPHPLSPQQPIPAQIVAFNSTNTLEHRIMLTAVDVEHLIYHSKEHPVRYLTLIANRSTSASVREALGAHIPRLTSTMTYDEVSEYLRELKRLFQEHAATFSAVDQEEILFALDLFEGSNRYQHAFQGLITIPGNHEQIRYEYFTKTIERAYRKAQRRHAMLVVRIGSRHVDLTYQCEAKYFAVDNPATKGKVMTLHLVPVYEECAKENPEGMDLGPAVKPLMKPGHYCYLALPPLHGAARRALKYSRYFPGNRPVCDGLLFIKAADAPGI